MFGRRVRLASAAAAALVFVGLAQPVAADTAPLLGTFIVQFEAGADPHQQSRLLATQGATVTRVFQDAFPGAVVQAPQLALSTVLRGARVRTVEPMQTFRSAGTQKPTPSYGLDRIDQRTRQYNQTFSYGTTGKSITAYVLDSGMRTDHREFAGRVARAATAVHDGRGVNDCVGHGTHVAGILGGRSYGVAKNVTFVPVRVLTCNGSGTTDQIIGGLEWMIRDHQAGVPAVANLSLAGGASPALDAAVNRAIDDGITVVVAAGNGSFNACFSSPARVPRAITVAATTETDGAALYSNWGNCVDLYAPGQNITSAWHTNTTDGRVLSGTSMAAPHVAGAAAAVLEAAPRFTPAQVEAYLVSSSTKNAVGLALGPNRLLFLDPALRPARR